MAQAPSQPGLDGLTADELAASRRRWWDDAFSELLASQFPETPRVLLDVGCGLATAAHALLPRFPATRYVGIDADRGRLEAARKLLEGASYSDRVALHLGRAEALPLGASEVDAALVSMTLQHLSDPGAALAEIHRVLCPGGTLVAVEPDQTAQSVYFDGVLEDVTAASVALFRALRRRRRPGDIAIGPTLGGLVERAGFRVGAFFPHVVGTPRKTTAKEFVTKASATIETVARDLPPLTPEVEACRRALADFEASVAPTATGYAGGLVPLFICVAHPG